MLICIDLTNSVLDPVFLKSSLTYARSVGILAAYRVYMKGRFKEGASLFFFVKTGQEEWAQIRTHEIQSEHKTVFAVRVGKHWNSLPKEVVESPSLEMLRTCLDVVLGSRLSTVLLVQGVWTR